MTEILLFSASHFPLYFRSGHKSFTFSFVRAQKNSSPKIKNVCAIIESSIAMENCCKYSSPIDSKSGSDFNRHERENWNFDDETQQQAGQLHGLEFLERIL